MEQGGNFGNSTADGYGQARREMVETQIRKRHVTDGRVLECLERVPRHEFLPAEFRECAYEDGPVPIGEGQTISQPYIVATMTAALRLQGNEHVLEIGPEFGYESHATTYREREAVDMEFRGTADTGCASH